MAKPPKDPKPAARRAPRKATATSTARRAAAAPPKQAAPVEAEEAPKVAAPPKPPKATPAAKAAAKPATTAPRTKAAPRAKPAAPKSVPAQAAAKIASVKAALPKSVPNIMDVAAATKAVTKTVSRNRWTIGAIVAAAGAGLAAFLTRGRIATALGQSEGHVPTDLKPTDGPSLAKDGGERAIPAFRPDMDAPMTAAEREALRPATTAPTLVGDRGGTDA